MLSFKSRCSSAKAYDVGASVWVPAFAGTTFKRYGMRFGCYWFASLTSPLQTTPHY
jgi:hypothetical protein